VTYLEAGDNSYFVTILSPYRGRREFLNILISISSTCLYVKLYNTRDMNPKFVGYGEQFSFGIHVSTCQGMVAVVSFLKLNAPLGNPSYASALWVS
jgi:hypothetical protein